MILSYPWRVSFNNKFYTNNNYTSAGMTQRISEVKKFKHLVKDICLKFNINVRNNITATYKSDV